MVYNPTPKVLANESALVSLSMHGYGPADLPERKSVQMRHQIAAPCGTFMQPVWYTPNPRGRHVNAPMLPRDYQSFAA